MDRSYRYSVLFRVCFGTHPSFKMLGSQFGLDYVNTDDVLLLHKNLHNNLLLRLESSMTNYNFNGDEIIVIQLLLFKVEYTDTVHKSMDLTIKTLGYNKDLLDVNQSNVNSVFNKVLPHNMDLSNYGTELETKMGTDDNLSVLYQGNKLDLSHLVNKQNLKFLTYLTKNTKIFVDKDEKYFVAVKPSFTPNLKHEISVFTTDGKSVLELSDKAISNTMFTRKSGNITKTVNLMDKHIKYTIKNSFGSDIFSLDGKYVIMEDQKEKRH